MAAITGVYKITSPNNRVYIGSSIDIHKRWKDYFCLHCKSQKRLYNSLKKYGVESHKFEIIEKCDELNLLQRELYWGEFFNVLDRELGLNSKLPKIGDKYGGFSKESKIKMSESSKGQIAWNKGIPQTEEIKKRISTKLKGQTAWNKGKKWSEESKKKMSEASKGCITWNKGKKTNQITHNSRLVLCQETGIFYYSIERASVIYNLKPPKLRHMLLGNTKNTTSLIFA